MSSPPGKPEGLHCFSRPEGLHYYYSDAEVRGERQDVLVGQRATGFFISCASTPFRVPSLNR